MKHLLSCFVASMLAFAGMCGVSLSQTAQLVFPSATLDGLSTCALIGKMGGSNFVNDGTEVTFFNRLETKENDVLTKVTYQAQAIDTEHVKAATVEFTNGEGGVYAKLADGNFTNYSGTFSGFGNEPISSNATSNNYIPFDLRLVAPAKAISVNFTHDDYNLNTTSSVRYGAGAYAVPYSIWNNMPAANNGTATFGGVGVKITGTRGSHRCSSLSTTKDLRHGYIDENDSNKTPTVTVTDIPYNYYRIVAYAATDAENVNFGYMTINGKDYTGTAGVTISGTANWGASGAKNKALGLREGVNYLVSGVESGSTATIVGHRSSASSPTARGCIAAVQIVGLPTATYTATIDDGGEKTFSALSWDSTVRTPLKDASFVVNVNEDTTLVMGEATNLFSVAFNVASGKTLTLSGDDVTTYAISVNGEGQVVVSRASHLQGIVSGSGTIVYPDTPSGADFSTWEGNAWVCDTSSGVATGVVPDGSIRSLSGWSLPLSTDDITEWIIPLTETREEFGKGALTVTDVPSGVTALRVTRPDNTTTNLVPSAGTATLTGDVKIDGASTIFDITFKNNESDAGTKTGTFTYKAVESATLQYDTTATFNNSDWDDTTGVYIKHHPYLHNAAETFVSLGDFTAVVVGTMSPTANRLFIHIGSSQYSECQGILIATTENADEVIIAANSYGDVDVANGVRVSVPNAATARHAFVISRNGNTFHVWVDGVKRGSFTVSSDFILGSPESAGNLNSGIQVGADYGGQIRSAGTYEAVAVEDTETGVVNVIRVFDYAISDAQAEAVVKAYPYVSQGGLFSRTVSANGTLSQDNAWTKDDSEDTYAVPEGTTVNDVYYNPSATLNVTAESEINVNTNLAVETLTVGGSAAVSFVSDGDSSLTAGTAIFNSPVTIEYGALNISAAPIQLGSSGSLAFDCSGIDISGIHDDTRIQLTGLIDRNDEKVTLVAAPVSPYKSVALVYNTSSACYDLVVSMVQARWTGEAGDTKWSTAENWSGNAVPEADTTVVITSEEDINIVCDEAVSSKSLAFSGAGRVTVSGEGSLVVMGAITSTSTSMPVINVAVEFKSGDAFSSIDVTGEVDFQGGVTGTVPVNHSTFYGNYTLTATSWTLSASITLAENATVTASEMTLDTNRKRISAKEGSRLSIDHLKHDGTAPFGDFAGTLIASRVYPDNEDTTFNAEFAGILKTGQIRFYSNNNRHTLNFTPSTEAKTVFAGSSGISAKGSTLNMSGSFYSLSDWQIYIEHNGYNDDGRIYLSGDVAINTSNYTNSTLDGFTVTLKDSDSYGNVLLGGSGSLSVFGNGCVKLNNSCLFTGGLVASNGVTVAVNKGVYPGKGNVTIKDTATLDLVQSDSGTVPVEGALTMEGGSTLNIATVASGVLPLSVKALVFDGVTEESKVKLSIGASTLENGYYSIISSSSELPTDAVNSFELDGVEATLVVQDNAILLQVGDVSSLPSGVWVGGVDTKMSNPLNWKNLQVPAAGSDLDFSSVAAGATVDCDLDGASFGAAKMGEGVVAFTGSFTATSFTDMSKVAVGADSTVTLDGNLEVSGSANACIVYSIAQNGRFVVAGNITATADFTGGNLYPTLGSNNGKIVVGGLIANQGSSDSWSFRLIKGDIGASWVIGSAGMVGTKDYWIFKNNNNPNCVLQPYDSDFAIKRPIGNRSVLTFNTTGEDGNPHVITIGEGGSITRDGIVNITGSGKVVIDYDGPAVHTTCSLGFNVKDAATLALNGGADLGTGALSLESGAILEVAESATFALGGSLALESGSRLGFNFTDRATAPVLDLTDKTVAFTEAETTNVIVKVSAADKLHPTGGKKQLTDGYDFTGVNVSLAEGAPEWVKSLDLDDNGNIVVDIEPPPFVIIIR